MRIREWVGRLGELSCAVVGLGISNLPLVDFLMSKGARITARDRKGREEFQDVADALERRGIRLICGEDYLCGLDEDVIFRSPGLRPDLPAFAEAVERGAVLTSEMELFLELTPTTVFGITGSDGKTTTTTLTGKMLQAQAKRDGTHRVFVGGNIGEPLLPRVGEMSEGDLSVAELSSFQLMRVARSPRRAAVTNLSPNHLNWHTDMEEYIRAKTNICSHAPCELLVTNADNALTRELGRGFSGKVTWFSSTLSSWEDFCGLVKEGDGAVYLKRGVITFSDGERELPLLDVKRIRVPGRHNVENYMTAIALTWDLVSADVIGEVADAFRGVRHRLEWVRQVHGVAYYNSSIDSSPSRTQAALSALSQKPIVICGGCDKNLPFEPLASALCERARAVVLTGEAAPKIRAALNKEADVIDGRFPIYEAPVFADAVKLARDVAREGDTVLLSPACTSFDAFSNFEERGDAFCRIVETF